MGEAPKSRFDLDRYFDPRPAVPGRTSTRFGGFLEDIDGFAADFFGIAPREADRLDPQQRLLLEVAWEALEDAGEVTRLSGTSTGVFVAMWLNHHEGRLFSDPGGADFYMTTGSGRYSASGRLSYLFDLQGPSLTVDTACSSWLAAVLPAEGHLEAQIVLSARLGGVWEFWISSRGPAGVSGDWTPHARGRLSAEPLGDPPGPGVPSPPPERAGEDTSAAHQQAMKARGLEYGPAFQGVQAVPAACPRGSSSPALLIRAGTGFTRRLWMPRSRSGWPASLRRRAGRRTCPRGSRRCGCTPRRPTTSRSWRRRDRAAGPARARAPLRSPCRVARGDALHGAAVRLRGVARPACGPG